MIRPDLEVEVHHDASAVADAAAARIAEAARAAVAARGRFVLAVSGGRTPWVMLARLAQLDVPWRAVELLQVDERVAPDGDPDRNLTQLRTSLLAHVPLAPSQVHAMPVGAGDLEAAAREYSATLESVAGRPPVIDLVHLGLGPDGHTASLVPGDASLAVADRSVATAGPYQGRRRLTLTYPVLDSAREVMFVVTGADKAPVYPRLLAGDPGIPAGRVRAALMRVIADREAAGSCA
ncbi:MAG: 6-phosphogluconolactonase [Steroidobacteraceae bacterium]